MWWVVVARKIAIVALPTSQKQYDCDSPHLRGLLRLEHFELTTWRNGLDGLCRINFSQRRDWPASCFGSILEACCRLPRPYDTRRRNEASTPCSSVDHLHALRRSATHLTSQPWSSSASENALNLHLSTFMHSSRRSCFQQCSAGNPQSRRSLYEHAVAMRPFAIVALFLDLFDLAAQPRAPQRQHAQEVLDGHSGTLIAMPPLPTYTGAKIIPDTDHLYIAPGPEDLRGPCPGMKTLANHGYIPRSGIASFEDIVSGMMEAFNLDRDFGAFITALNMLMRGNPFVNRMSIGGVSPLVPPLPNNAGTPGGISLHGGIEGDASMTRADTYIGDNINFQNLMYDMDLVLLGRHGGN
uniref:Heme-thiolate peroxidase n=1 Tax=Mycena chlorophos TaxID=658473 RepID=A0ABQ0LYS3_MYCCL|nr:heme-thiolate peroxidase [Mycena chlorophos]